MSHAAGPGPPWFRATGEGMQREAVSLDASRPSGANPDESGIQGDIDECSKGRGKAHERDHIPVPDQTGLDSLLDEERFVWIKRHVQGRGAESARCPRERGIAREGFHLWSRVQEGGTVYVPQVLPMRP